MARKEARPRRAIERDDLFRFKLVGDVAISANGDKVAYVVKSLDKDKDEYVGNIHVWSDGSSRQYTFSGKDSTPRWSPDGNWLAFISGRDDKAQIFLLPTSGGEAVQLTKLALGAGEPIWSPDSTRIAFSAAVRFPAEEEPEEKNDEKKPGAEGKTKIIDRAVFKFDGAGFNHDRRSHIFVAPVPEGEVIQVTKGDCNDRSPAWAPDGQQIAFSANRNADWDTKRGSDIWVVSPAGGEPRMITKGDGGWYDPFYSPDGRNIGYVGFPIEEEKDPDYFGQIWTTDRAGKKHINAMPGLDMDIGHTVGSDWACGGDTKCVWNGDGIHFMSTVRGTAHVFRLAKGKAVALTEGSRDIQSFAVSAAGQIGFSCSDPTHPAEIFRLEGKKEQCLTAINQEALSELRLAPYDSMSVKGADGENFDGWVIKPFEFDETKSYPLLLYIHGGPATAYGHSFFHELQWWAGQGYGVAICNPHGSSSYGLKFENSIRHDWGNRDYQDIMSFTDAIVALPWVDESRVAAAGGSYGGYMVNWLAGHTDRFAAFCAQRSICNMVSQGGTSDFAAFRQERSGGTPERNPDVLWNQSPLKYASNAKTPTLILHQELDHRCPIEQGEQWFTALKRMGVPTRFIRFPQESHGMSRTGKPSRRHERLGHMRDWFSRYV